MKASVALAVSGIQAQRRGREGYRAKASYVDETLFGSHVARQADVVEFDPPWVDKQPERQRPLLWSPAATRWEADADPSKAPVSPTAPRKTNKYRLKCRTPSYCDETLFSTKSGGQDGAIPWMKEDAAKLRPLLWTSPPASRNHSSLPSCQKEKPWRAIHRETPRSRQTEGFEAQKKHSFWKYPVHSDEDDQGILGWTGYHPNSPVYSAFDILQPPETDSRTNRQQNHLLLDASVAFPGSRPHSKGISRSPSARLSRATGSCKPRPPWK
uniref:RBPJ-interacting and tubulin-associated protein 1 n=1 Tax=Euleptes europaea TaxID=460621 RepID=UPI0025413324|nr:RBPJ-interacting and tubulin-associated protein 1 [Euleptes europaea]